ncbi:MAG TPA: transglutaminase-like cysteine peptidase [Devosiaceae bacterium]|nr:transglutaminase-like cysteine peptidase [Devosiaceae bacterium]
MSLIKAAGRVICLALFAAIFVSALPAAAAQRVDFTNVAFAPVTGPTSIPIGHADFCRRNPKECQMNATLVANIHLTPQNWAQLLQVNTYFNTSIVPETDQQLYHVAEYWTYPHGYGDCEDIALAKRRRLIEDGWPVSTLLMTVAKEGDGEGHAVLMVRTDRGDLILDNQDSAVRDWRDSPYHFLKRQSQADAGEWVSIDDERQTVIIAKN